ncbi:MAG: hypothetical protein NXI16_01435 [Alphaproteobacteria bacterium]|nr:hypothetical protein [Alphaproteobacteria bacterium]
MRVYIAIVAASLLTASVVGMSVGISMTGSYPTSVVLAATGTAGGLVGYGSYRLLLSPWEE